MFIKLLFRFYILEKKNKYKKTVTDSINKYLLILIYYFWQRKINI